MSITFEEIMNYHPGNRNVYDEIKTNIGQLLPFVGAGLTAPFYGSWSAALQALGEKMANPAKQDVLTTLLKRYKYLEAAQLLDDTQGGENLAQDMVHYFSQNKLEWSKVQKEAVFLLPLLFRCPVLTTNFDEGIETVYHHHLGNDFRVLDPFSDSLRTRATDRMDTPCLFKLHGSIYGNMTDTSRLVFTLKQYRHHYGLFGKTKAALKTFIKRRSLLFLGCSLEQDRTVDVIRKQASPGKIHFAIVNAKPGGQNDRVLALSNLKIRAIVYPDGQYESVRVILEKLLEELHPEAFQKLSYHASDLTSSVPSNPYVYWEKMTPLLGREKELDKLKAFVTQGTDPFRWWAITGAGGSGKSRLALELREWTAKQRGWSSYTLKMGDYDRLEELSFPNATLVVADYVQAHATQLGKWMEHLYAAYRTTPLRLLLVEREGDSPKDDLSALNWVWQLFDPMTHKGEIRKLCWEQGFLPLPVLEDETLMELMTAFAQSLRERGGGSRSLPTEGDCAMLLKRLHSVDPELRRPLYAMFLTGAWMQGDDPSHWSREQVLDYIVEREQTRLEQRIQEVTGSDRTGRRTLNDCLYLYRLSTALQGIPLDSLPTLCPTQWKQVEALTEQADLEYPDELLRQLELVRGEELRPMEPDLMGEYFVYRWLSDQARPEERRVFLKAVWTLPLRAVIFFDRLFADYAHLLNAEPEQWGLLLPPLGEVVAEPEEEDAFLYAVLAVNAAGRCGNAASCEVFAAQLEAVAKQYPQDREIALRLAKGLFNLSCEQDAAGAALTLERLEKVKGEYPQDREIALVFANGLVSLSAKQDAAGAAATLERLEKVKGEYPQDREIALVFAQGLFNLSAKQDAAGAAATLERLEKVKGEYPQDREIALVFAQGLVNLSNKQDAAGAAATLERLEKVKGEYPADREIALALAQGLVNLSSEQDAAGAAVNIERLEKVKEEYPADREIALALAKGLVNLSNKQDAAGAAATLERLEKVKGEYPQDREIALVFAQGLFNLSNKQDAAGAALTLERLEKVKEEYPQDREIALQFAKGLVNLSNKQDAAGAAATIKRLEKVKGEYPQDREIALELAKGLVNLAIKLTTEKNAAEAGKRLDRLKEVCAPYPKDRDFCVQIGKGILLRVMIQPLPEAVEELNRLPRLLKQFPEDEELLQGAAFAIQVMEKKLKIIEDMQQS